MASKATFKFDRREFDKTLKEYREYSKRDAATICNTKAYYIARGAVRETPRATKAQIRNDLMENGRLGIPLIYALVNCGRKPGLYGKAMAQAVKAYLAGRKIATLAAGWIPSIKKLEPLAESIGRKPAMGRTPPGAEKAKGYAVPAKDGWRPKATIVNDNQAIWDTLDTATAKATPALQAAFDAEEQSMRDYVERKLSASAKKAGIKTK